MPGRLVPLAVGRTAFAVSGLADSGLVHRLTRGRLWIGALATLLVGIVSLNVLALSFNATSSRVGRQADGLKREISALRAQIATHGASNQRVQAAAASLGLFVPEPGDVGYLRAGEDDAAVAAKRLLSGELTTQASYVAPMAPGDRADDDLDDPCADRGARGDRAHPDGARHRGDRPRDNHRAHQLAARTGGRAGGGRRLDRRRRWGGGPLRPNSDGGSPNRRVPGEVD